MEQAFSTDKYAWAEGDDTGLKMYDLEGFAQSYGVNGGGLLKETSENYYAVATANEFLDALLAIKQSGKNSVIELTADIALGNNEVDNFASYSSVKLLEPYAAQALTHPKLIQTGVTKLNLDSFHNLTIFSRGGYSILHANITMKNSSNIMIRNIKFDELWEWDEATGGDYDRNDWDYMTIDQGCDGVWIDHCTFYKAYDGVIDVKNPAPEDNVTISWCEFLPGSENNTFFDQMMNEVYAHPEKYPATYQHMKEEGMTDEQVYMYAYGQKKTHLFGQSDDSVNAAGIQVTLANNYYKDSMDRMPRLRFGVSHVYNCIMDAQELLDAKDTIANAEIAKKIVSNGASSTCGAHILLENCYLNGIQNALNSGNGSSPSGYINAVNSVYYMYGEKTKLEPKSNSTADSRVLVTDAESFVSGLPYSGYHLYAAATLDQILLPRAGAGKLNLTVLQWEKVSYNAEYAAPSVTAPEVDVEVSDTIPEEVLTDDVVAKTGCDTVEKLVEYLKQVVTDHSGAKEILSGVSRESTSVVDVAIQLSLDGGVTWVDATKDNFPTAGVDITIPYPKGTDRQNFDFVVGHLIVLGCNGQTPGTMEYLRPSKTEKGLQLHVMSASPFVIGWVQRTNDSGSSDNADDDDDDDDDAAAELVVGAAQGLIPQTAARVTRRITGTKPGAAESNAEAFVKENAVPPSQKPETEEGPAVTEEEKSGDGILEEPLLTTAPEQASHTLRNFLIGLLAAVVIAAGGYMIFLVYRRKKEE